MVDHGLQRSGLGKKMARAWNDLQSFRPSHPRQYLLVEFDDAKIGASDDEKSRRPDPIEGAISKIGTATARDHSAHAMREFRGGDKCSRCTVLAPNSPSGSLARKVARQPEQHRRAICQQGNVEHVGPIGFLCGSGKIKQQRSVRDRSMRRHGHFADSATGATPVNEATSA
jgi:hypothetical protein